MASSGMSAVSQDIKYDIHEFLNRMGCNPSLSVGGSGGPLRGDFSYLKFERVHDSHCSFSECTISHLGVSKLPAAAHGKRYRLGEFAKNIFKNSIRKLKRVEEEGQFSKVDDPGLVTLFESMEESYRFAAAEKMNVAPYESHLATVFVNHVLKKIAPDLECLLDGDCSHKPKDGACSCGCGAGVKYVNTKLGCKKAFHGRLDAVVEGNLSMVVNADIAAATDDDDADAESDEPARKNLRTSPTTFEFKKHTFDEHAMFQALATCMVYSFSKQYYQGKEIRKEFIPTVLLSKNKFTVFLYDALKDMLLISQPLDLQENGYLTKNSLFYLWCLLNLDAHDNPDIKEGLKSGFLGLSKGIDHYKNYLTLGSYCNENPDNKSELKNILANDDVILDCQNPTLVTIE